MTNFDSAMDMYRQMAANIPDCSIYIFDENYDYLLAEGEEISKSGLTSKMLVGANFFEVWPQEVCAFLAPYYQDTLKGIRQKIEKHSDTGYFIQHFIPVFNDDKEVLAGMVVSQNISVLTETRQKLSDTSRELHTKEQLLEEVINTLSEGIIVSDRNGKVLLSNPATEKMLGVDMSEGDIQSIADQLIIKPAPHTSELQNQEMPLSIGLHGGSLNGYVTYVENRISRSKLYVENTARPIYNEQGHVEAAILVMRNISLRKELEDLVGENISTLKQKNERLESLLHQVAKNMRGPVANINILLSLVSKAGSEEHDIFLEKIRGTSRQLERSVNTLSTAIMTFTSVQEEWVANDMDEVVELFRAEFKDEMREQGLYIKTDFEKNPVIVFPANLLKAIVFNLLSNIVQFGVKEAHPRIELFTFMENKELKLHVELSGIDCDLEEVFGEGWGMFGKSNDFSWLGVYMARNHLESLGGNLKVNGKSSITLSF